MQTTDPENFSEFENLAPRFRRKLMPWWMRFFSWLFMIMGAFAVPIFFVLFFNRNVTSSIFALDEAFPYFGQHLSAIIMVFNGFVGLWLWLEKKDAIRFAIICAVINIVTSLLSAVILIVNGQITFRVEFIFAILFLVRVFTIKEEWENEYTSRYEHPNR